MFPPSPSSPRADETQSRCQGPSAGDQPLPGDAEAAPPTSPGNLSYMQLPAPAGPRPARSAGITTTAQGCGGLGQAGSLVQAPHTGLGGVQWLEL